MGKYRVGFREVIRWYVVVEANSAKGAERIAYQKLLKDGEDADCESEGIRSAADDIEEI